MRIRLNCKSCRRKLPQNRPNGSFWYYCEGCAERLRVSPYTTGFNVPQVKPLMQNIPRSQIEVLFPYWPKTVEWFIIGGLARENEAQALVKHHPHIRCVGIEPNPNTREQQKTGIELPATKDPFPGVLLPYALWDKDEVDETLSLPTGGIDPGRSQLRWERPFWWAEDFKPEMLEWPVKTITLDTIMKLYGPFDNVALWLDIEGSELRAFRGAEQLLDKVIILNFESHMHRDLPSINKILVDHGLYLQRYGIWDQD